MTRVGSMFAQYSRCLAAYHQYVSVHTQVLPFMAKAMANPSMDHVFLTFTSSSYANGLQLPSILIVPI
jgi:hypothetical protein